MKRYGSLFFKYRRFHHQYRDLCFRCPEIAPCLARNNRKLAYSADSSCMRQYSTLGLNRISVSADDAHSDGAYDTTRNIQETNFRGWSQGYGQNIGHIQQQRSSTTQYHATNDLRSSPNRKDEVNLQQASFSTGGQNFAFQHINNLPNVSNGMFQQSHTSMNVESGVACPPHSYQQEHVPAIAGVPLANPSGYYNVQEGAHQQNSIQSQSPHLLPPQQVHATPPWQSAQNDGYNDGVESTLTELYVLCKEWDLENAVRTMIDLSEKGVLLDLPLYLTLIDACGKGKALKEARDVHQHLIRFSSPIKVSTLNKILEMYGRCGSMEDAYNTFNNMLERNITTWDTMITWLAKNGLGEEAIDMFTKFKEARLKPDSQIFLSIFSACGVLGDVTEGMLHFDSMIKHYGIAPTMEHYASIVHMFGSAGDLDGALEFIEDMPVEPSVDVWESLMNIARVQGNVELGDRCAQIVEQIDPARLSKELKDGLLPVDPHAPNKKVKKHNPLEHVKHEYRAGDKSHPESDRIYRVLKGLKEAMKEAGYVAETKFVLHDIDPEGKEEAIMAHSERLAGTMALLTTAPRCPIRIIKNLRVCGDCHNYFKILSDLVGREIIMRDAKRFHHFRNGKCSCNDYW